MGTGFLQISHPPAQLPPPQPYSSCPPGGFRHQSAVGILRAPLQVVGILLARAMPMILMMLDVPPASLGLRLSLLAMLLFALGLGCRSPGTFHPVRCAVFGAAFGFGVVRGALHPFLMVFTVFFCSWKPPGPAYQHSWACGGSAASLGVRTKPRILMMLVLRSIIGSPCPTSPASASLGLYFSSSLVLGPNRSI